MSETDEGTGKKQDTDSLSPAAEAAAAAAAAGAAGEACNWESLTTDGGAPVERLSPSAASREKCTCPGEGGSHLPGISAASQQLPKQQDEGQHDSPDGSKTPDVHYPAASGVAIPALLLGGAVKHSHPVESFSPNTLPEVRRSQLQRFMQSSVPDLDKAQRVCDELKLKQAAFLKAAAGTQLRTRIEDEVNEAMAMLGWQMKEGGVSLCLDIDCCSACKLVFHS